MTHAFVALNFSFMNDYGSYYVTGAWTTVKLAFFTVLFGGLAGMLISLLRLSGNVVLRFLATAYIEVIRGTPLLVQLFIIYFSLPVGLEWICLKLGLPGDLLAMSDFVAGVVTLSINSAAYVAEIFRAGIQAVDKGQMEAARSIGMPRWMAMVYIILPQAIRNILPALGNEFVVIIKESSQVMVIGIAELMYNSNLIRGATYISLEPLLVAAAIYFSLTFPLSKLLSYIERRLKTSD
ncbi:MAG: polar amino acid transporter, inner rane subunit [Paenibacillaceae bacterium]|jgi:polar amino acid transport system permease protein|nr:polar amino acid transporter, inner rane subunit [Paenibacillaceae bacterium]